MTHVNQHFNRRNFIRTGTMGLGAMALTQLVNANQKPTQHYQTVPAKAKHVIFMHMVGGPSQMDLFDPKPALSRFEGKALPASLTKGKKFAFINEQSKVMSSPYKFKKYGESGMVMSELLPHLGSVADDLCQIRSMQTDEINHSSAQLFFNSGHRLVGRPSFGAWTSYGLGTENENLPAYVVFNNGTPVSGATTWGAGFLPAEHQGVRFQNGKEPIFYMDNPKGINHQRRGDIVSGVNELNRLSYERLHDPEINARISQYELAYRMQTAVPDLVNINDESKHTLDMYGIKNVNEQSVAKNCLLARRLVERGVRFVQLFIREWDHHQDIYKSLPKSCSTVDQPSAALIRDLKERGLLDKTLIIWGGEFGRTPMAQDMNAMSGAVTAPGRDHHKDCFTILMAGGGIKPGMTYGATDDFGFDVTSSPIHVHDWHATCLHLLGVDHERLTYKYQGLDARLTQVHGHVVHDILS